MTAFNPFPTAPSTGDFSPAALTVLSQTYLNFSNTGSLVINDCVISAMAKSFGMVEANSGRSPVIYQDTNILKAYENYCNEGKTLPAGSYGPGCVLKTCVTRWGSTYLIGVGDKIQGYVGLNFTNPAQLRTALAMFGNLIISIDIPQLWELEFLENGAGYVWDIGDGAGAITHCVLATGWEPGYLRINSWGGQGLITDRAVTYYSLQAYAILFSDIIPVGSKVSYTFGGLNISTLRNYMIAMTSPKYGGGQMFVS